MNTVIVKFDPHGNGHCLYTEIIDLASLGALEIARASHVEFNNALQVWEVRNADGVILFTHLSRASCLAWEIQYFNR